MTPSDLHGPFRVTVRLHRHALWAAVALVLLAALALPAGRWYVQSWAEELAATGCTVERTVPGCGIQVRGFLSRSLYFQKVFHFVALAVTALPLLLAAFAAGPLIGRELESGTYRLQWTQSVSPARWLAARLAVPVAAVLLLLPAFAVLAAWIRRGTLDTWYPIHWYAFPFYGAIGPVAVAYALLGIAVGALAGLVIGRTVPAMAAALALVGTVGVTLTVLRPRFWPALDGPVRGGNVWDFSGPVDRIGIRHHPESHFWPLQLVESAILLTLAAVAILTAFALLRRRHH